MKNQKQQTYEERELHAASGWAVLILAVILYLGAFALTIAGGIILEKPGGSAAGIAMLIAGGVWLCIGWIPFMGLRIIKPNEAMVLTLFGRYTGTLKREGFFFINPFSTAVNPESDTSISISTGAAHVKLSSKKLSLKALTHDNHKQKINDQMGNPIEVGIVVIWHVVNTAKAVFNVDNYKEYLSIQADSTLRDVVRRYPYDSTDSDEKTLRGSSQEVSELLREQLQQRVENAGLEIIEARITHLAYAPEIAAAMLQRQQATAIIEARQKIVDGAVGMVEMALNKLSESEIVELDDERRAQMVSNLLVVLCGNKDAQPIVNSGSIY